MMKASDKYNPAYLKEMIEEDDNFFKNNLLFKKVIILGLMCQKCTIMVTKCSGCGERFSFADRIYCASDRQDHVCQNCWERKKKVISVN